MKIGYFDYFNKKYTKEDMFKEIKIDIKSYRMLKQFYTFYNSDSNVKTIPLIKVEEVAKIITLNDLLNLKYTSINSKETNWNETIRTRLNESKDLIKDDIDKYQNDKDRLKAFINKPVDWWTFMAFIQSISLEKGYTFEENQNLMKELYSRMKTRRFDFKAYQQLYRNTFYNIFMKTVKDLFTVQTDPDFLINTEYNV
jgi:hypothetical protein